jgi:hypothetical protein
MPHLQRLARASALAAAIVVSVASPAAALPPECPTFFPDFRCERHGRYEGFVAPVSAPYLFEDPFITTGLSAWYVHQSYPGGSIFNGGQLNGVALQARVAITDRLAFIATKDGFVWSNPDLDLIDDGQGFVNIAAGFKYALVDLREQNFILTPALRIEAPVGGREVYSGHGDGVLIPSISSAWGIGDFHAIGSLGGQVPFDMGDQSTQLFYNLHLDYALFAHFVPLVELNGYHWTGSGNGNLPVRTDAGTLRLDFAEAALGSGGFEGLDLLNLGSPKVSGRNIVTFAAGARIPITRNLSFGAVYEFPITHRKNILKDRVTANLQLEF